MPRRHCPTCSCFAAQLNLAWRLAVPIAEALSKTRFKGLVGDERWWRAEFRAHNGVPFAKAVLEAEAWCASNPRRAPHKEFRRFLNSWFQRAESDEEGRR